MLRNTLRRLACVAIPLVLTLSLMPPEASAQIQAIFGAISGQALDQSGGALPGVAITARNVATGLSRSVVTDAEGRYRLLQLPVGSYQVTAELSGFTTVTQPNVVLTVGQEQPLDLTLRVAASPS